MGKYKLMFFLLLCSIVLSAQKVNSGTDKNVAYEIRSAGITVQLNKQGNITGILAGDSKTPFVVSGGTLLDELAIRGKIEVKYNQDSGSCVFTRNMADIKGHTCIVTDRFIPTTNSIRWEIEIHSDGEIWTTPISTRLKYSASGNSRFWTAWGDPDDKTGSWQYPEAWVPKIWRPKLGSWQDPMEWRPLARRTWFYQFTNYDMIDKTICMPLFTIAEPKDDAAFTFVQSPEDTLLNLALTTDEFGTITLSRTCYRLGGGRTVRFSMDLVCHPADSRAGLGWMVKRYQAYFDPPNPDADKMAGCGAYSGNEEHFDAEKLRKMAFRVNWKCSEDFPYMGLFLPPMTDAQARWDRAPDEITPGKPLWTCYQTLNDYSLWMRSNGFYVLNYFNVTEYGRKMQFPSPPRRAKNDTDLWKDPHDYLFYSDRRSPVVMNGNEPLFSNCYGALIVDPGDSFYQQHLLEQARRHIEKLPDSYGICIDRNDWLGSYNTNADDGVSWIDGHPARSLFLSWKDLMSKLGPIMHEAGKVIFVNDCAVRLETLRHIDGIYSEWTPGFQSYFSYSALLGLRKPVMVWTNDGELNDAYFQRCLYLGIFPTAPYPNNNHCLRPSALADSMFLDYGPLMDAMRGKKWVLEPHCVETTTRDIKVNLFEVPGGYALPVTFGGKAESAIVRIRNISGLDKLKLTLLHPGEDLEAPVVSTYKDGVLELVVPLVQGCGMVKLIK